jgi:surface antigen
MHFKPLLGAIAATALFMSSSLSAIPLAPGQTHWECVPIARILSGIAIRGNALTWWGQAEGRYARGAQPKRGAVLAFKPYGSMVLGHVAAVSRVVDDRTILVTHSNWSPINGRKGQIERDVKVVDASPDGDWSSVRVWYAPMQDLGTTAWPVHGFIYPDHKAPMRLPDEGAPVVVPTLAYAKVSTGTQVTTGGPRPTGRLNYLAKILKR